MAASIDAIAGWAWWLMVAAVLVLGELVTGTFYLLMLALALSCGGLVAFFGGHIAVQLLVAAMVGVGATYSLRHSRFGQRSNQRIVVDPNINMDIGQLVRIDQWQQSSGADAEGAHHTARIKYRGALWDVELLAGERLQTGLFIIVEIRGSCLIVSPHR